MFLLLKHKELDVYKVTKNFVLACYRETMIFPSEEKFGMTSQIRRAALSVQLNVAEGCSRKSVHERKRFYEIARGSLVEIDTALELAVEMNYTTKGKLTELGSLLIRSFQLISKMML